MPRQQLPHKATQVASPLSPPFAIPHYPTPPYPRHPPLPTRLTPRLHPPCATPRQSEHTLARGKKAISLISFPSSIQVHLLAGYEGGEVILVTHNLRNFIPVCQGAARAKSKGQGGLTSKG